MSNEPRPDPVTTVVTTLARLAAAIDARDWTQVAASFTADGVGYGATGRDAIVARMRAHLDGCGPTQHLLGNHRVTIAADGLSAQSFSYARVHHVGAGPMVGSFYECMGEYDDRWVRTGDRWALTSRWFEIRIELGDRGVLRPAEGPTPAG